MGVLYIFIYKGTARLHFKLHTFVYIALRKQRNDWNHGEISLFYLNQQYDHKL